jgi:DNA-binding NtrC family response regulator
MSTHTREDGRENVPAPGDPALEGAKRTYAVESPGNGVRVLIVEDDDDIREAARDALLELGYDAHAEANAERALAAIHQHVPAAVIADVRMPGMSGIEFCKRLTGDWPEVPVLLMTAFGDVDMAVDALRAGALDFIPKPISFDHLAAVLGQAVSRQSASPAMVRLEDPAIPAGSCEGLVGSSEALRAVIERIARVAPTQATVLITGESGTGKELVARAVHDGSPRKDGPFVALSCAAMPQGLLEAELFGYRRGAFTGAVQSRDGLFQRAEGGTLFLDEIGDLPLPLQPKLLRVLEERRVRPIGSSQEVALDVRIVAATNRDLEQAVRLGHFREDLLFRLNVHHLHLPPLRERGEDVMELAHYFLSRGVKQESIKPESGVVAGGSMGSHELFEDDSDDLDSLDAPLAAERAMPISSAAGNGASSDSAGSHIASGSRASSSRASSSRAAVTGGASASDGLALAPPPVPLDEASPAPGVAPFPRVDYRLTPEAESLLRAYRWPGNVRELENALCGAMALAKEGTIGVRELPARLESSGRGSALPPVEPVSLEEMERRHIEIVLRATGRNKALAARKLGIDRATLYRKLLRLGLSDPQR